MSEAIVVGLVAALALISTAVLTPVVRGAALAAGLGVFPLVSRSLKTTNVLESVNVSP